MRAMEYFKENLSLCCDDEDGGVLKCGVVCLEDENREV